MKYIIKSPMPIRETRRSTKNGGLFRTLMLRAVLLGGVVAACGCGNDNGTKQTEQTKLDSLAIANDSLQSKFDAASVQIDAYATRAVELEERIKQKDAEIAQLNKEKEALVRKNRKLVNELKANKKLISSLRDELADTTRVFGERLGLLEHDKKDLIRQRDSLLTKYNQVVALGSVLHASNIRLSAINLKRSGRETDTRRARKADLLRIVFDIDENRIAENGTKKVYLVIKDPSGTLLSSQAAGSGSVTNSNGKSLSYSLLKEIPLVTNQPVRDVIVDWNEGGDYQRGSYTIDIYNGGFRIGGGKVELK